MNYDFLELSIVYDLPEFKAYVKRVENVVTRCQSKFPDGRTKGTTIGEIHRQLGENAKPEWTLASLEWIDHLMWDGVPTRYYILKRQVKQVVGIVGDMRLDFAEDESAR